jgi:hypothetical protein
MSYDEQFASESCAGCRAYEQERVELRQRLAAAEAERDELTILNQDLLIYRDDLRQRLAAAEAERDGARLAARTLRDELKKHDTLAVAAAEIGCEWLADEPPQPDPAAARAAKLLARYPWLAEPPLPLDGPAPAEPTTPGEEGEKQ